MRFGCFGNISIKYIIPHIMKFVCDEKFISHTVYIIVIFSETCWRCVRFIFWISLWSSVHYWIILNLRSQSFKVFYKRFFFFSPFRFIFCFNNFIFGLFLRQLLCHKYSVNLIHCSHFSI